MNRYYYDLHVHSCLSPCGENDMTPNTVAGLLTLAGMQIAALTDHNTCKNCPALFEAAKRYGLVPVAGMELTTAEEIHVVCLLPSLEAAAAFDDYVFSRRMKVPNNVKIFGDQLICDGEDNVIGTDGFFLPAATEIMIDDVPKLIASYGGVAYPAHVDRESGGCIAVLGTFPDLPGFDNAEFNDQANRPAYEEKYPILQRKRILCSSDAHNMWSIRDKAAFLELEDEPYSGDRVRRSLFELLGKPL